MNKSNLILEQTLHSRIKAEQGFLSFADFMQIVLYTPGYGYYTGTHFPLGSAGDFITAPMLGSLFSKCLANQCSEILKSLRQPIILECGAGSGCMAAQLLMSLEEKQALPSEYWILELGAGLQQEQKKTLEAHCPHLLPYVRWLSALPAAPFEGIILGNEVLDALPLTLFQWDSEHTIWERGLTLNAQDQLSWAFRPAGSDLKRAVQALQLVYGPWVPGYQSELSLMLPSWISTLAASLKRGAMLWIDYGGRGQDLYHASCSRGSLRCYESHRLVDSPLENLGRRDITAHVNFTAVGQAGISAGLSCVGYANQALFLINCGLEGILSQQLQQDPSNQLKVQSEARKLIHPVEGGMGERFKVIALTRDYQEPLTGFLRGNQLFYL